ncbi:hypothetical protein DPMN_092028 [Dreissena polymorpha]|uniref:Uncharacterized protein n=1 Tax=Dreissena polymorpha TaxID=45954 RepID=A0A9D4L179_DREPO|nr:hypothetical protein DPMN_092028 [Dreissena polymorpha]
MEVPPKRTILIVMVKLFGTMGEDNPLKRTPLCSQYRNWTAAPMFGGYIRPWHYPAVSECLDLPGSFRLKAGCVCTLQQDDGPVEPSGQLFVSLLARLHFHHRQPQFHTFMKHPIF